MIRRRRDAGFTLVELMIMVTIVSVITALAIPAYQAFARRSKAAEVADNFAALFKRAAALYAQGSEADVEAGASMRKFCSPEFAPFRPDTNPGPRSRPLGFAPVLNGLGMEREQEVYFSYGVLADNRCDHRAGDPSVLTFMAIGDLDDDDLNSEHSLAVGSDGDNRLYHGEAIYREREYE